MDITMDDCALSTEQESIINTIFNVNDRDLCVKTVAGAEYTFRVSKSQLHNTFFPHVQPIHDAAGVRWYAISQYHIAHNRFIELYMAPMKNTFKVLYKDTGLYEDVVVVS